MPFQYIKWLEIPVSVTYCCCLKMFNKKDILFKKIIAPQKQKTIVGQTELTPIWLKVGKVWWEKQQERERGEEKWTES